MIQRASSAVLRPDRRFVQEVIAAGGHDLKQCFQCATCSAVCELSDERRPFPRKEMHWAQWGLSDRLLGDSDIWLCYQCNDCSVHCPRGARPGDVLAAIRRVAVRRYARPHGLAARLDSPAGILAATIGSVLLLGLALLARAPLESALGFSPGREPAFYAAFFPHWLLIGFFSLFVGLAVLAAVSGVVAFWRALRAANPDAERRAGLVAATGSALLTILSHRRFGSCTAQRARRLSHLGVFFGFLALFVVTAWAVIDLYVNPLLGFPSVYPFALLHPMKLLANAGAALLVAGSVRMLWERRGSGPASAASTFFDRYFLWLLLAVGLTGLAVEVFRFTTGEAAGGPARDIAYGVYFVHLVLVFQLLVFLPYTKFAHVLYRTVALVWAAHTGLRLGSNGRPALAPGREPRSQVITSGTLGMGSQHGSTGKATRQG